MLLGLCPMSLFGWIWSGHHEMTSLALSAALTTLAASGKLDRLGSTFNHLRFTLRGLWLVDCCQDLTVANAVGLCGVEVPGGQVSHFMRDSKETPAHAYDRSRSYIHDHCLEAWRSFRKAFPRRPVDAGQHGRLHDLAEELLAPVHFVKDGLAFLDGQRQLARALHTLQDAFSPAHVLRDPSSAAIADIYTWDDANKHARPEAGWPGHNTYDHPAYNQLTQTNADRGQLATARMIACVLGSAQEAEVVFRRTLDRELEESLAKRF